MGARVDWLKRGWTGEPPRQEIHPNPNAALSRTGAHMSSNSTIPHPSPSAAQQPVKPVTERALISRINRILAHEGKVLRVCRYPSQGYHNLGRYYQQDIYTSMGGAWFSNLGELIAYAREIEALGSNEALKPETYR